MCICNRNWQASDCSERICQFGLAHVDTPKGDLDMSGSLSGPNHLVVDNAFAYPYGTTEQFPAMEDTDLRVTDNSAHYYMECSNKGKCDRSTGECVCYDGYDGVACQRASCPGYPSSCSGHGVCKSKAQLASSDDFNLYRLWDKDSTMGCECDVGYSGADCSEQTCKNGIDPLYLDDSATIKFSTFDFATLTTAATIDFTDGALQAGTGHWAIRFFDVYGEDWLTPPIAAGASCSDVVAALESLPNNVISPGNTYCSVTSKANRAENTWKTYDAQHPLAAAKPYLITYNLSIWEADTPTSLGELSQYTAIQAEGSSASANKATTKLSGYIYRLKFYGNPGALKQPQIELYLDGKRPSLVSPGGKVITKVWTDGQQGESNDYFADHCDKVTVTVSTTAGVTYLAGMTGAEKALLKACLGDSDFDSGNNVGVYNWDVGSAQYPHLIKLVRTVSLYTDGGYYAALWFDSSVSTLDGSNTAGTFKLLNPFTPPDHVATDVYEVYTTKGTLALTSNLSQAVFSFASNNIFVTNTSFENLANVEYDGDISCEVSRDDTPYKFQYVSHCLNKSDIFTLLNWDAPAYNPPFLNLYTATRVGRNPFQYTVGQVPLISTIGGVASTNPSTDDLHYQTHLIRTDLSTNWGHALKYSVTPTGTFRVYKFFPAVASTYNYVGECSNRGLCARDTGICTCFPGYTNDDCSVQNSIAL